MVSRRRRDVARCDSAMGDAQARGQRHMMHAFLEYVFTHKVEIAGALITWLGIWLTARRVLACWPVVLAADFLYLAVFYEAKLYSDALLQCFFVVFTLYGWWHWWRGVREEGEVRVVPLG